MTRSSMTLRMTVSSRAFGPSLSSWTSFTRIRLATPKSSRRRSMAIDVVKPGFATTVQDLGRPGYYHLGIPLSGAMDRYALRAANLLVGNNEGDAGLEAVFRAPGLCFTSDATVAVTGAELPPKVDGDSYPTWTAFRVRVGQTLSF